MKDETKIYSQSSCRCIMKISNCFIFLSLFNHLMIINLADSKCEDSFQCEFLGSLKFPLSNMQPECGYFMVNCSSSPTIQLENGGKWYRILQKLSENKFRVRDDPTPLAAASTCNLLKDDHYLNPNSPSISIAIDALTSALFKCPYEPYTGQINPLIDDYFSALNYSGFNGCAGIRLYYRNSSDGSSKEKEIAAPQPCVQMPFQISEYSKPNPPWFGFLDRYLTAEFDVQLSVSDACVECHQRGGWCGNNTRNEFLCRHEKGNWKLRKILLAGGVSVAVLSAVFLAFLVFLRKKYTLVARWPILEKAKTEGNEDNIELFFKNNGNLAVRRYKYSHLKKMTKSFSEKLGQGGYGSVYKGKLSDGHLVAVKVLNESKENGKEFLNELASISRTSHVNIVTLLGFCFEGAKRALIYEFMPNGSLERYIVNATSSSAVLGWNKLFEIAVGIARGLEYLHQGCNTRILHFDIKPHNILLDKDFNPKISDFGLAKLCPNRSSIVSMLAARGTMGYIAPELFSRNYEVSHKSDVYSYGMMILEMAGERKDIDRGKVDHTSEMYFPQYIYRQFQMEAGLDEEVVSTSASQNRKRKLIIVGLWCIQANPRDRPSMTKVVEMLEGKVESLQLPNKPYIFSPSRSASQFTTSESV